VSPTTESIRELVLPTNEWTSPTEIGIEVPQRRLDLFTGKHVLIAATRDTRPDEYERLVWERTPSDCPFCLGNESQTPSERLRNGESHWLTRVFPNKFPAVSEGCSVDPPLPAAGGHEVIVESSRHVGSYAELTDEEARSAFSVYSARLRHYREQGFASGHLFKNFGPNAGASLEHVHSQLIALHRVPSPVRQRDKRNWRFRERWNESIASMVLRRECRDQVRLITEDDDVVAFAPFASRAPYEMRILPKRVEPAFEDLAATRLDNLSRLLHRLIKCLEMTIPDVSYNVVFHTRTWRRGTTDRWQIELVPRVTRWAGFELATDEYINPVWPELAARRLRKTLSGEAADASPLQ